MLLHSPLFFFFFFNDTATTEIYTLSLHDALPISQALEQILDLQLIGSNTAYRRKRTMRSEEHTSELQSRSDLVCRLLLEKKKKYTNMMTETANKKVIKRTAEAVEAGTACS